jgi:hypothetical protein
MFMPNLTAMTVKDESAAREPLDLGSDKMGKNRLAAAGQG